MEMSITTKTAAFNINSSSTPLKPQTPSQPATTTSSPHPYISPSTPTAAPCIETPPPCIKRGLFHENYGWHPLGADTNNIDIRDYMKKWIEKEQRKKKKKRKAVVSNPGPNMVTVKRYGASGIVYQTTVKIGFQTIKNCPFPVDRPALFAECPKMSDGGCVAVRDIVREEKEEEAEEEEAKKCVAWKELVKKRLLGIAKGSVCWRKGSPVKRTPIKKSPKKKSPVRKSRLLNDKKVMVE
ncbi:uncharacterized protein LAJ45_07478 [Morchella importuna]|uniref:uncharacterized protein n=1 Tax=Morchella importuna TaxID=1174673 RepID=UPI001E8E4A1A|nr:uncharacterized protein LAJ45_07478 [Morchella importuna]KAH8148377.1 hypothetical protein LAJ45_07478 [Morchella importuna]